MDPFAPVYWLLIGLIAAGLIHLSERSGRGPQGGRPA